MRRNYSFGSLFSIDDLIWDFGHISFKSHVILAALICNPIKYYPGPWCRYTYQFPAIVLRDFLWCTVHCTYLAVVIHCGNADDMKAWLVLVLLLYSYLRTNLAETLVVISTHLSTGHYTILKVFPHRLFISLAWAVVFFPVPYSSRLF